MSPKGYRAIGLPHDGASKPRWRPSRSSAAALVALGLLAAWFTTSRCLGHRAPPRPEGVVKTPSNSEWSWDSVQPRRKLTWEPCYKGEYDCARLDVPMD